MKRYLEHIKSKSPHERRTHAMQLSGGIVVVVFIIWLSTLGLRFAQAPGAVSGDVSQLANITNGAQNATLLVSTSTQQ